MSDIVLVLGPVAFADFEIPERIRFGGMQRLAVHQLPGGGRVIDALGRDDCEICWSGAFTGEDATARARLVDALRVQGGPLPLTWDVFFYSVAIAEFTADYCKNWWIPYRITCTVLRDEAEAIIAAAAGLATDVVSDIGIAAGLAGGVGVDLSGAQTALTTANAVVPGTAAYAAAQTALQGSQSQIGRGIDAADLQAGAIAAGLPATTPPAAAGIAAVTGAADALGRLGTLTAAKGYVGRSLVNLQAVET